MPTEKGSPPLIDVRRAIAGYRCGGALSTCGEISKFKIEGVKKMRARKSETIKQKTIIELNSLGIYREEFATFIDVYAELVEQYQSMKKEISIEAYSNRSPAVISLENLRKDILQYSAQLGLTPSGYRKIIGDSLQKPKRSKLEDALNDLG